MNKIITLLIITLCVSGCMEDERNTNIENTYNDETHYEYIIGLTCQYLPDEDKILIVVDTNAPGSQLIRLNDESFLEMINENCAIYDSPVSPGEYIYELHTKGGVVICSVIKPAHDNSKCKKNHHPHKCPNNLKQH